MSGQECHFCIGQIEADIGKCILPARVSFEQVLEMDHANKIQAKRQTLQVSCRSIRLFSVNLFKQGAAKFISIKDAQVIDAFANADKTNRDVQFIGNRKNNTALRGAIQFGDCDTGQVDRFVK